MSIEAFKTRFPADPREIRGIVERSRNNNGSSLVVVLARNLVYEAAIGLRRNLERFSQAGQAIKPDDLMLPGMSPEHRQQTILNYTGIVFGISVASLEHSLINRVFDASLLTTDYNIAITGTPLKPAEVNDDPVVPLTYDHMRLMYQIAGRDLTFALFFQSEGFSATPVRLREFISDTQVFPWIQQTILPMYHERARFLI